MTSDKIINFLYGIEVQICGIIIVYGCHLGYTRWRLLDSLTINQLRYMFQNAAVNMTNNFLRALKMEMLSNLCLVMFVNLQFKMAALLINRNFGNILSS